MAYTDLVEQLSQHKTLASAPREELTWLASHGEVRHLAEGDVLTTKGAVVESFVVLLTGHIAIFVDRGAGIHKVMEWRAGDVTGMLPYSRMVTPPGDTVAQEPCTILALHRDQLPAMIRECHQVTSILVHKMLDRARAFTSSDLHDEKMASLGKLSAGLAHELNNPAAAIERSAVLLEERLEDAERATRVLGASRLTEAQLAAIDAVRASCLVPSSQGVLSPLQRAEREEAIGDWLDDHDLDSGIAASLAETAVTLDALDRIADAVEGAALDAVLRWAAAGCSVRELASEIQDAAMRISGLVQAIKGFTHMDQATVAESMDLALNLGNTITILRSKARAKSIAVTVEVEPELPRVRGLRRRTEPGLGESDRQRARCGRGRRSGRRESPSPATACRGVRHRQRHGHPARGPGPHVRPVLHHQARRKGDRPRTRHRPAPAHAQRRRHRRRVEPGPHGVPRVPADRRRRRTHARP